MLHHQFVASAPAVKAARRINPEMKVGCMLAMVPLYPYCCNPDDVMFAQESMRETATSLPMCSYAAITRPMC